MKKEMDMLEDKGKLKTNNKKKKIIVTTVTTAVAFCHCRNRSLH